MGPRTKLAPPVHRAAQPSSAVQVTVGDMEEAAGIPAWPPTSCAPRTGDRICPILSLLAAKGGK